MENIKIGDFILVEELEIIPVDSLVIEGWVTVNEKALFGNFVKREVMVDLWVLVGSCCESGCLFFWRIIIIWWRFIEEQIRSNELFKLLISVGYVGV